LCPFVCVQRDRLFLAKVVHFSIGRWCSFQSVYTANSKNQIASGLSKITSELGAQKNIDIKHEIAMQP
jgi:hypothetical protein